LTQNSGFKLPLSASLRMLILSSVLETIGLRLKVSYKTAEAPK